jgi:DNA-binding transcriptional regulator YdaS (Cro superfamily)
MAESAAPTPAEALRLAVQRAGTQTAFARLIGKRQAAISKWLKHRKSLAAEHVLTVEAETGVSRHLLRPDLYPTEDPSTVRTIPRLGTLGPGNRISGLQLGEPAR